MANGTVMDTPSEQTEKQSSKGKWLMIAVGFAALLVLDYLVDIETHLKAALAWIESKGSWGMIVFVLLYIAACVFVIPGSVLTLGGGAVYGLPVGFALVSLGSTLGATATFIIARYLARDAVSKKTEGNPSFKVMDDAVAEQGWKIVFLTRLSPVFPFNVQNYGYGLTKVSLFQYILASWIGMMPGTVLYVYVGVIGGDAAEGGNSAGDWVIKGLALVATIIVTVIITKIAKKALNESIDVSAETSEEDSPS